MALLDSVPEILGGIAAEAFVVTIAAGVLYRFFAGRFLIPKRDNVLPNQNGVIVQGDKIVRVVRPGACWIRPRQRVVLCDMRPRPLQMAGVELICSNSGVVRISLSGKYQISDAAAYYRASSNAGDAIYVEVRRTIAELARQQPCGAIVASPESFAERICNIAKPAASALGLEIVELAVWEARFMGRYAAIEDAPEDFNDLPGTLVH